MSRNDAEGAKNEHRRYSGESTRKLDSTIKQQSQKRQPANNKSPFLEPPNLSSSNVDDVESLIHDYSNIDLPSNYSDGIVPSKIEMVNFRDIIQRMNEGGNYSSADNFRVRDPELKTSRSPSNKYRSIEQPTVEPDHFDDQRRQEIRERSEPPVNRSPHFDDSKIDLPSNYSDGIVPSKIEMVNFRDIIQRMNEEGNYSSADNFRVRAPEPKSSRSPSNMYRSIEQPTVELDQFDDQRRQEIRESFEPLVNRLHHFEDQRSHSERERFEPLVNRSPHFDDQMRHSVRKGRLEPVANESHYKTIEPGTNKSIDYFNSRHLVRSNCFKPLENQKHYYDERMRHDYYSMPRSERFKPDFQPESMAKGYPKSDPYHRDEIDKTIPRNFRTHSTWNKRLERIEPNLVGRNESPGRKNEVTGYDEFGNDELDWSIEKERRLNEEQDIAGKEKKR